MRIRVHQIKVSLDYEMSDVFSALARKLRCGAEQLDDAQIVRRSVDARFKDQAPVFILTVEVNCELPESQIPVDHPDFEIAQQVQSYLPESVSRTSDTRPVVVGAGPAGLLTALTLAEAGCQPLLVERGGPVETRWPKVSEFWKTGEFDAESNALYGEGGAGLFSDGKLTARSKDKPRVRRFLQVLVDCGASPDILLDSEPHVGTDVLKRVIPEMRRRIEAAGGEIRFHTRLEDVYLDNQKLCGVRAGDQDFETDTCFLAVGHSARDVYKMLAGRGVMLQAKPFAVGVRVELPQRRVDCAQYGQWAGHPRLGAASFRLTRREERDTRACYTFCMCPGGEVIACASSPGMLTTNGMSYSARAGKYANAAFLVPAGPADFNAGDQEYAALAGCGFQERIEAAAFQAGGGDFSVPASMLVDFLSEKASDALPDGRSCRRANSANLHEVLPDFVSRTLVNAVPKMLRQLRGAKLEEAVVYAAETRSSSPLRIVRDEQGLSVNTPGLYPVGEGAGYAGGIVSSAVDGIRAAQRYLGVDA